MQLYKMAAKLGRKSKELMEEMNDPRVTSHLSAVPEEILASYGLESEKKSGQAGSQDVHSIAQAPGKVVKPKPATPKSEPKPEPAAEILEKCPYSLEEVELGCRGCGNKSPMWKWRHLLKDKE